MENFNAIYEAVNSTTLKVEDFANGTGYYDALCLQDVGTEVLKFQDQHGRRGLIAPMTEGFNVVIFERYKDNDGVLVSNTPTGGAIDVVLGLNSMVDDSTVYRVIGDVQYAPEGRRQPNVRKLYNILTRQAA